ncbi:hypothetical protein M0D68_14310 [Paraburkholderia sp. SEWSISQ10-3 4]|uniref:hypothetical protein n=1 Tax=Paraburkholderia TaxID=1822464 RepID=UPI0022597AA1|nr:MULTISPECIES: hypothetical protein [Paraburkholderia]MCX4139364.1 hypothetical protein [Paraburkholderia aspalathi]MDN7172052.1 hypothetical protein [Paraburkholderia sp. SEWSISQ10-3 4]MDQ6501691.1 hypothetical protein [Paraburkholderia aspalathi]
MSDLNTPHDYHGEIAKGLVLFLDPAEFGNSEVSHGAVPVQGGHYFVCLGRSGSTLSRWFPVFSATDGKKTLLPGVKSGIDHWTASSSYYYRNQVWTLEDAVVNAAAHADVATQRGVRNLVALPQDFDNI